VSGDGDEYDDDDDDDDDDDYDDGDDYDDDDDYDALFKGFDWNDLMSRKLTAPVRAPAASRSVVL